MSDTHQSNGTLLQESTVKNQQQQLQQSFQQSKSSCFSQKKPEFFLYTTLGQNETKHLKKARTNRDERSLLASIFNLNTLQDEAPDPVELLKLDFLYINFTFCKEHLFSNEKTSTLIAMADHVLSRMLKQQLTSQQGFAILKAHLAEHSI